MVTISRKVLSQVPFFHLCKNVKQGRLNEET